MDFEHGTTETHEGEALIKKTFRKQSNHLVIIATKDKLNHKFIYQSLACHEIDYLITDQPLSKEEISKLNEHHIQYLY